MRQGKQRRAKQNKKTTPQLHYRTWMLMRKFWGKRREEVLFITKKSAGNLSLIQPCPKYSQFTSAYDNRPLNIMSVSTHKNDNKKSEHA
jgi:hypothetical protein